MSDNLKPIKTINFLKQVKKLVKTKRMKFQQCFLKAIHSNQLDQEQVKFQLHNNENEFNSKSNSNREKT